jgi:hypothetical protein
MRLATSLIYLMLAYSWHGGTPVESFSFLQDETHSQAAHKEPLKQELAVMAPQPAPVELGTEPVSVRVGINADARPHFAAAVAPASPTRLVLHLEGISFDKTPEIHYQVYVNLPKDEKPSVKSIYFVGNLAFFQSNNPAERITAANFDITRLVRELQSRNAWNDKEISVTFVMRWLDDREGHPLPVSPGVRVRFSTAKVLATTLQQ